MAPDPAPIDFRIGIDLGGTKVEGIALSRGGDELSRHRVPTPHGDYAATIELIATLIIRLEADVGGRGSIGIGIPGSLSPVTAQVQNANSTWLNGQPFDRDLQDRLSRPVRLANDANCFALSEAVDGAGRFARIVLGVILGTGCGGGIVVHGSLLDGPRGIGGEWGHNPLPWATPEEQPGPRCWCGRSGCMETWVSGPALAADHARATLDTLPPEEIARRARDGDRQCSASLERHAGRLARGLAAVVNVVDPDVIVLGGGLSHLADLYDRLPALMLPHVFADAPTITIRPPAWGDSGGVRGAAWLWD